MILKNKIQCRQFRWQHLEWVFNDSRFTNEPFDSQSRITKVTQKLKNPSYRSQIIRITHEESFNCTKWNVGGGVGVRLHLFGNLYGWGVWMWGSYYDVWSLMLFIWKSEGQLKKWMGARTPGTLSNSSTAHESLYGFKNHLSRIRGVVANYLASQARDPGIDSHQHLKDSWHIWRHLRNDTVFSCNLRCM